jgi:hypothetical protein
MSSIGITIAGVVPSYFLTEKHEKSHESWRGLVIEACRQPRQFSAELDMAHST